MDSCDVLIVGGGPAGSTLAWKLRRRGLDVLVLDRSSFPRDKVCAGWITTAAADMLQLDRDDYARERVLQPISGFRTGMIGGSGVVTRYGRTVSYGVRRSEFDDYLLRRSGARLRLGQPLRTMERSSDTWIVNREIKTPLVIGAGGHFCPVARLLRGAGVRKEQAVIAQEIEFQLQGSHLQECRTAGDTPELYFCEDLKGYGWCVRKGNYLNIGLGREDSGNLTEQVRGFLRFLRQKKRTPENIPSGFRGHAYHLYRAARQDWVGDGVMLVGDAAGLAHPRSGEGIRPAVESALTAAEIILTAGGNYQRSRLLRYPALLAERFRGDAPAPDLLPESVKRIAGRILMASPWFSRHVLLNQWFLRSQSSGS